MIRRINIHGGPGVGKSVMAMRLVASLCVDGYDCHYIGEEVKGWVWSKRPVDGFDQLLIFAKQLSLEDVVLRSGAKLLVTDCPLLTCCSYADTSLGPEVSSSMAEIVRRFGTMYRSLDLILERSVPYRKIGRFHDEEIAGVIAERVSDFVCDHLPGPVPIFHSGEFGAVRGFVATEVFGKR